jgi:hypothetical protein
VEIENIFKKTIFVRRFQRRMAIVLNVYSLNNNKLFRAIDSKKRAQNLN